MARRTTQYVLATLVIAGICLLIAAAVIPICRDAMRVAEDSAQRALLVETIELLDEYHREHGRYPDSLESLALTYPDGGDRSLLAKLQYESDGEHYEIVTESVSNGEELRESR